SDFSYAIAKTKWPKVKTSVHNAKAITIATKKLRVVVSKVPFRIEFTKPDGTTLNGDEAARGMGWEGDVCRSHRRLATDEMFFGCGEKTSPFNKRGSKTTFWNTDDPVHTYLTEAVYVSIPFLISTRPAAHYGIFWDNTHRTRFNLGQVEDEKHYTLES